MRVWFRNIGVVSLLCLLVTVVSAAGAGHADHASDITPAALRCEGETNPLGIESRNPALSWLCLPRNAGTRGARQTGYQILVASSREILVQSQGDLWDSGKVGSSQSVAVRYAGRAVPSATRCWWKVRIWDQRDLPSPWSAPACWDTGLLSAQEWRATWIGAPAGIEVAGAPCFRKVFTAEPGWKYARVFLCGLGYHTFLMNGHKADSRLLEPAQTDYRKRALYSSYDVTALIRPGANAVGVMLGNGWYNQDRVWGGLSYGKPCMLFRLELEYPGGRRVAVVSGSDWQVAAGPVVSNNIYAGETYNARRERRGWSTTADREQDWQPARVLDHAPTERLTSTTMPPVRATGYLKPAAVREVRPGVLVYDMGQNFAGWVRLQVRAAAGTRIRMRFAETIDPASGNIDTASTGVFATGVEQVDTYLCRGPATRVETWEPQFTYHGFRYVEVTGLPAGVRPAAVTGVVVHTDVAPIGEFVCSDAMINRIHRAAVWTLISNMHGHPTDCPARERCGWMGDAHACAEMAALNFDMSGFWTKYLGDIETSWTDVLPSQIAPGLRATGTSGNPDWGVAVVMLPWYRYLYYGDPVVLAEAYPSMARFVRALSKQTAGGIVTTGYGDWCPPGSVEPVVTPVPLTSTAWFIRAATITTDAAARLGKPEEAQEFQALARQSTDAFRARFYDRAAKSFGSQTGDAMALAFDLVPPGDAQAVADDLARDVARHNGHHDTGIFGSRSLFDCLTAYGHGDTAWTVLHKTDYPSIGYLFSLGATTFWECWGEKELDQRWGARSLNHPMQAACDAWFYQGLAGIQCDPDGAGFKKIILRPEILPGLEWVRAHYDCPYGRIAISWRHTGHRLLVDVTIPPNTTATLSLPAGSGAALVTEGGHPVREARGVRVLGPEVLRLESGRYRCSMVAELMNGRQ
jgi:alpha-L-rhamnosidase